ncbi:MAG TPA: nitrilase-related carbon-nitrogen hydrolase, partial [Opitutaceae bacterium]
MPKNPLRVASVQFESIRADKAANFAKIERFTVQAAAQGARLVVFPECCITGYWFVRNLSASQLADLAESIPDGPSTRRLVELARTHNIAIGAGLFETAPDSTSAAPAFHNSYVVALPDGTLHCHRKLHAFEHEAVKSGS